MQHFHLISTLYIYVYIVFQKNLHLFYFCNNFVDPEPILIIFCSDTPEENCNKPVLYFLPHLFSASSLYFVTQATNLTDIHSDKHLNYMVKSDKSQDKNADKTCKNNSRQSEQVYITWVCYEECEVPGVIVSNIFVRSNQSTTVTIITSQVTSPMQSSLQSWLLLPSTLKMLIIIMYL